MPRLRKRGLTTLLVGLGLWLGLGIPLAAQPPARTPTLAAYQAELQRALDRLDAAAPDSVDATLLALAGELQTIAGVELPSGETVQVLPLWRVPDGDDDPPLPDRAPATAQLAALLAQLEAAPHDNTAARLLILEEIFRRPEFNSPANWLDRFLRWLRDLWNRFFPDQSGAFEGEDMALAQRILLWAVVGVGVAAIIWLLGSWLQRLLAAFVDSTEFAPAPEDSDLPRTAAEARAQAQAAAESGEYRAAVRRLYLAALLQLSEQHWIGDERSLTNREVLRRIPPDSPVYPHLAPIVDTFDRVWYGIHEPDRATFDAYAAEIDALAAVARQAPPQPEAVP
jgi:hypothetical protein